MIDRDIKLSLFFCLKKQKGSCENFREDSKGLILYKKEYPILFVVSVNVCKNCENHKY